MALIQMVKSAGAATFGQMAGKFFDIITRILSQDNCTRVDLVFDQYRTMSIKAAERQERGESLSMEIKIHNQNTPVPNQWKKFISNPKNKRNLATFLCESLRNILNTQLHPRQNVVIAGGFKDGRDGFVYPRRFIQYFVFVFGPGRSRYKTSTARQTCLKHPSKSSCSIP